MYVPIGANETEGKKEGLNSINTSMLDLPTVLAQPGINTTFRYATPVCKEKLISIIQLQFPQMLVHQPPFLDMCQPHIAAKFSNRL